MKRKLLLLATLLLSGIALQAQCDGRAADVLDANEVRAQLYNSADRFWDLVGNPGYEVPIGSGKFSSFANAIWMGGLDGSGQLHLSAQTYRQSGVDFAAGPYRSNGNYECGKEFASNNTSTLFPLIGIPNGNALDFGANSFNVFEPATGGNQNYSLLNLRQQFNAIELGNGKAMVIGEKALSSSPSPSLPIELIDLTTYAVTAGATPGLWYGKPSVTPLGTNEVLVAGTQGAEIYNISGNSFSATGGMVAPRHYHDAIAIGANRVLIGPGTAQLNGTASLPVSTYEIYDNGTWSTTSPSTITRNRNARLTALSNGNVMITGGGSDKVEVFNTSTNTFSIHQTLPFSIDLHEVVPVGVDQYAILGSDIATFNFVNSDNFLYDFNTQAITYGPTKGYFGKAVGLTGGEIIVAESPANDYILLEGSTLKIADARWEKIWKVTESQIDQFLMDYQNNQVDFTNYPDIETWPGNGDVSKGEDYYLAPFVDVDGDGVYAPGASGDYPCISGQQSLWWVYNDDANLNTETGGDPLGVQVKALAYGYDCDVVACPDSSLDYVTFYEFEITNKSNMAYTDIYVGNWMDADVGNFADDYVGCDSLRDLAFTYNGNAVDGTPAGYGANPPAIGSLVLESPDDIGMTNFMYYENDFSIRGNPETPLQHYNYMQSRWKNGQHAVYGQNGYIGTDSTDYMYTGDPGFCGGLSTGWSEGTAGNSPFDRRFLQSTGPFTMQSGESVKMTYAVIWTRGNSNDNLGSVCELLTASDSTKAWFDRQDSCFDIVLSADGPEREDLSGSLYPNPSNGQFHVVLDRGVLEAGDLKVIDMYGRTVHTQAVAAGTGRISVDTELARGMYIVQVSTTEGDFTQKINIR